MDFAARCGWILTIAELKEIVTIVDTKSKDWWFTAASIVVIMAWIAVRLKFNFQRPMAWNLQFNNKLNETNLDN